MTVSEYDGYIKREWKTHTQENNCAIRKTLFLESCSVMASPNKRNIYCQKKTIDVYTLFRWTMAESFGSTSTAENENWYTCVFGVSVFLLRLHRVILDHQWWPNAMHRTKTRRTNRRHTNKMYIYCKMQQQFTIFDFICRRQQWLNWTVGVGLCPQYHLISPEGQCYVADHFCLEWHRPQQTAHCSHSTLSIRGRCCVLKFKFM